MAQRTETLKEELLEKTAALVAKRMSGEKARAAQKFVEHYYRNVPPADMAERDPEDLYGAAISIWTWGQNWTDDEPKIRVYNPRFDQHGWHSTHTVIEIINFDMPFLVDSVTMELNRQNLTVHLVVHPVFHVTRDSNGKTTHCVAGRKEDKGRNESFMHVEVDEQTLPQALEAIEEGLNKALHDVRSSVEDWPSMRDKAMGLVKELKRKAPKGIEKEDVDETIAFLEWIYDDHFTFLGCRDITYKGSGKKAQMVVQEGSGLGVLRAPETQVFAGLRNLGDLPEEVRETIFQPEMVRITKANNRATVHRRVHMDTIAIKHFDAKGKPVGETLFVGLLTSVAYNQTPMQIPLLRRKVDAVVDASGYDRGGHSAKALMHVLESYPRDELFQIDVPRLSAIATGIVHLQERQRIALFLRPDPFQRYVSALAFVPRERFSTTLRKKIGAILAKGFGGSIAAHYTYMSDEALSRVHFIIRTTPGEVPDYDPDEIEQRVIDAGRTWEDRLRQTLTETLGEETGLHMYRRYAEGFSVGYKERFNVQIAMSDLERIERVIKTGEAAVNLYQPIESEEHQLRFKIYNYGGAMILSEIMPMLENMGVKVLEEAPFDVHPVDTDSHIVIHDFQLETANKQPVNFQAIRDAFHEGFKRVWVGEVENDGFNRLILSAGLEWRDVVVLRAYSKYLRQAAIPFSQDYMEETLARNADLAADIAKLFRVRFDPEAQDESGKREDGLINVINIKLDMVENLDEDRILRRFLNIIQATLRTNFYQLDGDDSYKHYVAFKFASRQIEEIPQPAPLREIFVYSPRFEAVHLRFGMVARGGLRWSDRREDFRTEVLGLVKAQQVKNAVIVPVGSKGGFVLKKAPPPSNREAFLKEGIACYQTFIQGMLDITDNLVGDKVAPPKQVVRKDSDDPYLVVAADKGTATFSDFANEISIRNNFWLGDAFASGGSAGYDHKKMGITARGAWESVKRHFREMGHNTQTQPFTVIGVGDMGGDVFGNGMLLSEQIKLTAAFNHLHIFIDPDPDPASGFAERKRLFEEVKGWDQYESKLISKGGGVFDRKSKSIELTPEIRKMLDIDAKSLTPNQLISALLKSKVDLLWFGGIGTYIKHSDESNADVGDRANDGLRVDASELHCKVIGEGANLGMTHRARIEFAQNGGRANTDAIDNSAGVDCSDHEVNIKILLGDVVSRGDMTEKQRNVLLEEMTEEVSALVLRDNYQQTQSISMTQARAASELDRHQRMIRSLERAGHLNRKLEFLPDDEEIADRLQAQKGLTRPELSVLLAYAKNVAYQELLESDLPDDPLLLEDLERYFPHQLRERYLSNIHSHRLRREIIATAVTNSMINRTGPSFVNEMNVRTGISSPEIARAFTIVREVFGLRDLWVQVEALDNHASADIQNLMLQETGRTITRMTEWFLRNEEHPLDIARNIETYQSGVQTLRYHLEDILGDVALTALHERTQRFIQTGVPLELAQSIGQLKVLSSSCDVVRLAAQADQPVIEVGATYSAVGARFGMDWLRSAANRIPADSQWHRMALGAIIDDLWGLQSDLTARVLRDGESGQEAIETWIDRRRESVDRIDQLLGELSNLPQLDLAMLAVVGRETRNLVVG
ncbi:NAD-glutamate dehydrogenase [Aestuariispira ectoiniformans]|uniref:NAD-glutamate dehydrogenase n=1 Tax=Aestuariispira ectoiniformans TaxID=2775080 RepID=UPI00223AE6E8|nr:NAD-glutamate dehydrogenase [Aestuariispira ectoiniformans]